jgi:Predicted amidophosphoribosyltransferases
MSFYENISDLIFPPKCFLCKKHPVSLFGLCKLCGKKYLAPRSSICPLCGRTPQSCRCKYIDYAFDKVVTPFIYKDALRLKILSFKIKGNIPDGKSLSLYMAQLIKLSYNLKLLDYIIYVPMDDKTKKLRKFNQSELLAKFISHKLKIPVLHNVLIKTESRQPQHTLNFINRKLNVKNIFSLYNDINLSGKNILLVDDIITTGYTLDACSSLIKKAGAKNIVCAVAASKNTSITNLQ